ncbi:MAG: hypothetical protein KDA89_01785 [Planctomycetaceae bacterium]|nr:hypothetical protein [Planctomycetaceae bacterium]
MSISLQIHDAPIRRTVPTKTPERRAVQHRTFRRLVTRLMCWVLSGTLLSSPVLNVASASPDRESESEAHPGAERIQDVRLQNDTLHLQVVDSAGHPLNGLPLRIGYTRHVVAQAVTDERGYVSVTGMRPGLHSVTFGGSSAAIRIWTAEAAPPSAVRIAAIVADRDVVLGQFGSPMMYSSPAYGSPMMGGFAPAVIAAGVTAVAVVVVVAGKNSSDKRVLGPVQPASP